MRNLLLFACVMPFCFDEVGADGSVAGSGGGGAADVGTSPDNENAGAPALYHPEGMPDHYLGENDHQTMDKMHKALEGYRKQQGEGDAAKSKDVPKSADEYVFEEPEDFKGKLLRLGEDGKDPIVEKMKEVAHKFGMGKEQFQEFALEFSKSIFEVQQSQGEADADLADFSYTSFGGEEAAKPHIDGVKVWAQGLKNQGVFDEQDLAEIDMTIGHGAGLRLLTKVREATGEKPIPLNDGGGAAGDVLTEEQLHARISDPRYKSGSKDFDPAFHKKTTEMFQEFYGRS